MIKDTPVVARKVSKKIPHKVKGLPDQTVVVTEYVEVAPTLDPPGFGELLEIMGGTLSKKQKEKLVQEWDKMIINHSGQKIENFAKI